MAKKDKKPATKPWDQSHNPWHPDIFRIRRRKGFRPRFVDPDMVQRKLDEGWQIAKASDYGIKGEEGQVDSKVVRRGMILMEMPEELAQERDRYFQRKTDLQSVDARQRAKADATKLEENIGHSFELSEAPVD